MHTDPQTVKSKFLFLFGSNKMRERGEQSQSYNYMAKLWPMIFFYKGSFYQESIEDVLHTGGNIIPKKTCENGKI